MRHTHSARRAAWPCALQALGHVAYQALRALPANAGVCDGLPVHTAANGLVAVNEIGLHHEAAEEARDALGAPHGVQHLVHDARLLKRPLSGVVVVAVDDYGGELELLGVILVGKALEVLVVVVGVRRAIRANIAAKHRVRQRVSGGLHLPVAEDEGLGRLRGIDRVE